MTQATAEIPANEQAEFERELEKARSQLPDNDAVAWTPLPGSQEMFLSCPLPEVLYHGTRGPGKTDALLMSFAQHVGRGFGRSWRGILFRQTYPQLADVVAKAERWFRRIFPRARFNLGKMYWEFPDGEVLFFRHMRKREDYGNYHGHEYQWVGWEELSNWATDDCFKLMFSTLRSSNPDVPRLVRGTTNPYGVGHNWIKDRYRLAGQWNRTIVITDAVDLEGRPEPVRAALHGHIDENTILLESDPTYKDRIAASAANEAQAKAWLNGDWDVVAGGMFDDVWNARWNIVPDFAVPPTWRIDRGLDWGSSRPFSVGWYATSDGSDLHLSDGRTIATVRGDVFRLREWYGWTGRPNEGLRMMATDVTRGIVERELAYGWRTSERSRVKPGPADSSIWTVEDGHSIEQSMRKPVRLDGRSYHGVRWERADKSPGSRKNGWMVMRQRIKDAHVVPGEAREKPGFFVVDGHNDQFLRTVISIPRDEKDLDDVDTDAEDHVADEVRYRIRFQPPKIGSGRASGLTY